MHKMAFSLSRTQPFRDLIFTCAIFIAILAATASSTPLSPPSFSKLVGTVFSRNDIIDYGNTTDTALHLVPKTFKLTLPWWTSLVGASKDFVTAFWTVTFAWEKRGSGKPRSGWIRVFKKFASKSMLFIQTFAGFVHLAINSGMMKSPLPTNSLHHRLSSHHQTQSSFQCQSISAID